MLNKDTLTYNYPKRMDGNPVERALITTERSQKLDLLIHLLSNLQQALIICGPSGIGKTTLLHTLQASLQNPWGVCLQQGIASLSIETILINLSRSLQISDPKFGADLAALRHFCQKQPVLLIIDDAHELEAGLIDGLVEFAGTMPGLHLVFSMTYDGFHTKCATDKTVDDCHFIELPPLSLKDCADFLRNLSVQPGAMMSFNEINDNLVEKLYRASHGIPGKILAEIPKFNKSQRRKLGRPVLWLSVVVISLVFVGAMKAFGPTASNETTKISLLETVNTAKSSIPLRSRNVVAIPNIPGVEGQESGNNATPVGNSSTASAEAENTGKSTEMADSSKSSVLEANAEQMPVVAETAASPSADNKASERENQTETVVVQPNILQDDKKPPELNPEKNLVEIGNQNWIMSQPSDNYTLQVMSSTDKEDVNRVLKKYANYRENLKYYTQSKNDQQKYVVIYGSFPSLTDAKKRKAVMPIEFNRSLEKRFKYIQSESRH